MKFAYARNDILINILFEKSTDFTPGGLLVKNEGGGGRGDEGRSSSFYLAVEMKRILQNKMLMSNERRERLWWNKKKLKYPTHYIIWPKTEKREYILLIVPTVLVFCKQCKVLESNIYSIRHWVRTSDSVFLVIDKSNFRMMITFFEIHEAQCRILQVIFSIKFDVCITKNSSDRVNVDSFPISISLLFATYPPSRSLRSLLTATSFPRIFSSFLWLHRFGISPTMSDMVGVIFIQ